MAQNVEDIEKAVAALPPDELRKFHAWYEKFESELWDQQIESDVKAGKLEMLAKQAIADHEAGKSTEL